MTAFEIFSLDQTFFKAILPKIRENAKVSFTKVMDT